MTVTTPCSGADRDRWFSGVTSVIEACREACTYCPLIRECAQAALDTDAEWGVWASVVLDTRAGKHKVYYQRTQLQKIADGGAPRLPGQIRTSVNQAAAVQLRESGLKPPEIAEQLGLSVATVYKHLKAAA